MTPTDDRYATAPQARISNGDVWTLDAGGGLNGKDCWRPNRPGEVATDGTDLFTALATVAFYQQRETSTT